MQQTTILSGIQPTGRLHLGNYLGSLRNFLELQKTSRCFFMVADYHSLTENYNPKEKRDQILDLLKSFLAIGLDPKRSTIFIQSHVPEHFELAWIFNTITPVGYLERMTQYKDKAGRQQQNINIGLFDYPVLQAADILMYHATAVPVGQDQDQHLELTREIARLFNNRFGNTFVEPKTLHTQTPRVMSLLEPDKKMSKSLGDPHCLYLDDDPDTIAKKISRAVTDAGDGTSRGANNLLELLSYFSQPATLQRFSADQKNKTLKYAELKKTLADDIARYFAEFRKKKAAISDAAAEKIAHAGAKTARAVAQKTMAEVRKKIGVL